MNFDESGWVKMHRKLACSRVFQNPDLLKVWIWCLLRANHSEVWVTIKTGRGETEVFLKPGQFIFGRKSAAKELRMKPSSIRNRMKKLENMRNLDMQPDTHYTIITITNWSSYQLVEKKEDSEEDRHRTTKGQPKDTDKNDKNAKKAKYSPEFETFWTAYPRKKSKGQAWKTWLKLKKEKSMPDLKTILKAIGLQKTGKDWLEDAGKFIPHPATWLNAYGWDDEVETSELQEQYI